MKNENGRTLSTDNEKTEVFKIKLERIFRYQKKITKTLMTGWKKWLRHGIWCRSWNIS